MSTEVNPDLLRRFADKVDRAGTSARSNPLASDIKDGGSGLSGSSIAWALGLVSNDIRVRVHEFSNGLTSISRAVQGSADNYQVTDDEIAATFPTIYK